MSYPENQFVTKIEKGGIVRFSLYGIYNGWLILIPVLISDRKDGGCIVDGHRQPAFAHASGLACYMSFAESGFTNSGSVTFFGKKEPTL